MITLRDGHIRQILAPHDDRTAIYREKLRERLFWNDFYSRIAGERVLTNGGLLDVHLGLGACQQAVVDFMFAATAGVRTDVRYQANPLYWIQNTSNLDSFSVVDPIQ